MKTFLHTVIDDLKNKGYNLSKCNFVVPSKRISTFINELVASTSTKPVFEPITYSVEEFISFIAQVEIIPDIDLLFDFYTSYSKIENKENTDNLDQFITWAPTILKDFNEIDRFLVNQELFFSFLGSLKELEQDHWSILEPKTEMVKRYLHFWKKLKSYYRQFKKDCIDNGKVYQGLAYRIAAEKANEKVNNYSKETPLIFLGLNALNKAEEEIIQTFLNHGSTHVYWDNDIYFQENKFHEAGRFLRKYKHEWPFYHKNDFQNTSNHFISGKEMTISGTSGSIGIAQIAGKKIQELIDENINLNKTAIVLADENLLLPVLSAIPDSIKHLNVTMGLSLDKTPIASFFNHLIALKTIFNEHGFYYKNVVSILESHFAKIIDKNGSQQLLKDIYRENMVFLPSQFRFKKQKSKFIEELFLPTNSAIELIEFLENIIQQLKANLNKHKNRELELEQLLGITNIIDQLRTALQEQSELTELKTIHFLFKQLLPQKKLDFIGEPVKGLQVMGLLETRALDYEHLVMLSINEGILPAGKTATSYIPYDMKIKFGLPTYSDKDSVYAYHFYRLLQRCKTVDFIYNSEPDSLGGGEKSRFLMQLETSNISTHLLKNIVFANSIENNELPVLQIKKDTHYFNRLQQIAQSGFSPSSITSYIYNPIEFYRSKILKINEVEEVEENMAANTMGTMIHKALESLYQPFIGIILDQQHIKSMLKNMDNAIYNAYLDSYNTYKKPQGKNTIMYEVAKHYVFKMLSYDGSLIKGGKKLIIKELEVKYTAHININGIGNIKLHGEVDRIDELDGILRIIDYKSGKVDKNNVALQQDDYNELIENYDKSKAFQVLMYAYLYSKNNHYTECSPGIISFKNFKEGFMPYQIKNGRSYQLQMVNHEELVKFEEQLRRIILKIYDPNLPLIESN